MFVFKSSTVVFVMLGTVTSFERSLRYGDKNNDVPLYSRDRFLKGETFITC